MMRNLLLRNLRILLLSSAVLLTASSARADALDNWTSASFSPNNFFLHGVTYGGGRYVAVGQENAIWDYGVIVTSEDGLNWTLRKSGSVNGTPSELHKVTYANGTFVAVGWDYFGGVNLYHSANGIDWTQHASLISNFHGVTYGAGLFVAVGDGSLVGAIATTNRQIYTSANGSTWTARNSGAPANDVRRINDVAYGAGRFVAIDGSGYFYTSTSGTTWTRSTGGDPLYSGSSSVSFCNGLFIAACKNTNFVSADGLSWSVMVKDTTYVLGRVIFENGLYVALSGATILTSTNGTNWIQRDPQIPANTLVDDIAFGNANVVAVGYTNSFPSNRARAYRSDSFVGLGLNPGFPPQLKVSGLTGRSYRIEHLTNLLSSNWQPLATFPLTNSPCTWTDTQATDSQRYYRAVLLP